jgi:hypothetical protein
MQNIGTGWLVTRQHIEDGDGQAKIFGTTSNNSLTTVRHEHLKM